MMNREDILGWLREDDEVRLQELWARADQVRRETVGDAVHLRGLVEISNHCTRQCLYCGIRAGNSRMERYRMTRSQILECAREAVRLGYGSVVLQSGEDPGITCPEMTGTIEAIKQETPLAITLSLGEREDDELREWKRTGADRYLLRFETSNRSLFRRIHPPRGTQPSDRMAGLLRLRDLGYEIGSGVMVGLPGQTIEDLAEDLLAFARIDLDMIGLGPYVPAPNTPLWRETRTDWDRELMTYKMFALARLVCPRANIPATTALATINRTTGRELGLRRGANVLMPNLTPARYRSLYRIYPDKACLNEEGFPEGGLRAWIAGIGRTAGSGRGDSRRFAEVRG